MRTEALRRLAAQGIWALTLPVALFGFVISTMAGLPFIGLPVLLGAATVAAAILARLAAGRSAAGAVRGWLLSGLLQLGIGAGVQALLHGDDRLRDELLLGAAFASLLLWLGTFILAIDDLRKPEPDERRGDMRSSLP